MVQLTFKKGKHVTKNIQKQASLGAILEAVRHSGNNNKKYY